MTARPLNKVDRFNREAPATIKSLELQLDAALRRIEIVTRKQKAAEAKYDEAVRQISRFHALLIAERIRHINRKES